MVFLKFLTLYATIALVVNIILSLIVVYKLGSQEIISPRYFKLLRTLPIYNPYRGIVIYTILTLIASVYAEAAYPVFAVSLLYVFKYHNTAWNLAKQNLVEIAPSSFKKIPFVTYIDGQYVLNEVTIHLYLAIIAEELLGTFHEIRKSIVNEIVVLFYPPLPSEKMSNMEREFYRMNAGYTEDTVFTEKDFPTGDTGRTPRENYYMWLLSRNPYHMFNRLRRFPWKLVNTQESDVFYKFFTQSVLVFYNFFKTTIVAVSLAVIYFIYTIFFFKIQFLKQLSVWFVIGMLYFWLMSGFNFFLKRYQYGKFTSSIQRFWKRTNTYFWLIEGFLMLLFFYYYLNSSQEPLYMYDYSALNQEYLVSLHVIGTNVILLSLVIYFMYFTLLRINSNSWTQLNLYLLIISTFIFFSFFIETYQFYYVLSTFSEKLWVFNEDENLWGIDTDSPILRTKHQYLMVCLIAKYWHFLFIFLSWVFFLIKSFERRKVTYVLFGANLQNMLILYALNFACYLQWFKWIYRRFFDLPYTWFMTNVDNKIAFRFFFELKLLFGNLLHLNENATSFHNIVYKSLSFWNVDSLCIWKFI